MGLLKFFRRFSKASTALSVFNEIYKPYGLSGQVVVEEQREAVKPKPSPEDKKKPHQ